MSKPTLSLREQFDVVVVGHVDHGKSTVIGRLLADTGSLPEGKLEAVRATCERNSKPFEYAFLLDALENEHRPHRTMTISIGQHDLSQDSLDLQLDAKQDDKELVKQISQHLGDHDVLVDYAL